MYEDFCGIDFGTTNSAVSVLNKQNLSELIKFENGQETIPTAIYFPENDVERPIFGNRAIEQYINGGVGRFMRSLKRILGTDLMSLKTEVNGTLLNYEDILVLFIKFLKDTAESQIEKNLSSVVLGRPVHFQDFAPEADSKAESMLRKIALRTGFKNINFQYEPLAAAYAHEVKLSKECLACVIDIGGGTSDFSIIRIGPQHRQKPERQSDILANEGIRIGGNDFDRDLSIKCFMPTFGYGTDLREEYYGGRSLPVPASPYIMLSEWYSINYLYTYKERKEIERICKQAKESEKVRYLLELVEREEGHALLNVIEKCKVALSKEDTVLTEISVLKDKPKVATKVSDFNTAINADTQKVTEALKNCMKQAGVKSEDVELVVLTGGSTEIPYIKKQIQYMFPEAEFSEGEKLSSVGMGLVYEAARLYI